MARKSETQVQANESNAAETNDNVTDVSHMVEVAAPPTFEQQVAKLDEQINDPAVYPMVKEAMLRVKAQMVRSQMRTLQAQMKIVRNMMPPRVARVPRKVKAA